MTSSPFDILARHAGSQRIARDMIAELEASGFSIVETGKPILTGYNIDFDGEISYYPVYRMPATMAF